MVSSLPALTEVDFSGLAENISDEGNVGFPLYSLNTLRYKSFVHFVPQFISGRAEVRGIASTLLTGQ